MQNCLQRGKSLKHDILSVVACLVVGFGMVACDDSGTSSEGGSSGSSEGGKCFVTATACPATLEPGTICDARDGQVYKVVTIGTQTWMAENLNVCLGMGWCYDNKAENCEKYGRLYTWTAAVAVASSFQKKFAHVGNIVQGICPEGFRIPNEADWNTLDDYVTATYGNANSSLRGGSDWNTSAGYLPTNESGFNALPGGEKGVVGFSKMGDEAYFWVAEEDTITVAGMDPDGRTSVIRSLIYFGDIVGSGNSFKDSGLSVRCVKDL